MGPGRSHPPHEDYRGPKPKSLQGIPWTGEPILLERAIAAMDAILGACGRSESGWSN